MLAVTLNIFMRRVARLFFTLTAVFLAAAPVLAQQAGAPPLDAPVGLFGPTGQVVLHPLRQALLDVSARGVVTRPWLRVERSSAQVWNSTMPLALPNRTISTHTADGQLESLYLDMGLPVLPWLTLGLRGGVQRFWGGGVMDGLIEDFHATFLFYNFDRDKAPKGHTELRVEGRNHPSFQWVGPRVLFPSPVLSLFFTLLENRTTSLSLRLDWQPPLGDVAKALRLASPELGVGLSLLRRILNVAAFHFSLHALSHAGASLGGLAAQGQLLGQVGLEWRVLPQVSLIMEDRLQSPLFARGPKLVSSRALGVRSTAFNAYFTPSNIITGGARLYLPGDSALTLYVGEDFMLCTECSNARFSRESNAPDITIALSFEQMLPSLWSTPRLNR